MDKAMMENAVFPDCPIRNILAKLCVKWAFWAIYMLNKADKETVCFKRYSAEYRAYDKKS